MSDVLCACSRKLIDPGDAPYTLRNVPCCTEACMRREETRLANNQLFLQQMRNRNPNTGAFDGFEVQ